LLVGKVECFAQQLEISGVVDDTYGVVQGVTVTLRTQTGTSRNVSTDERGAYRFDNLSAGTYEISVVPEGFTTATRAVSLATQPRTVNVTLAIAGIVTSVDVVDVAGRTTASRMDVPNREIPSHVSVVSAATLQEQGVNDLAAALENVSGVITQVQYGVYEWYTIGGVTQQSGNDFLFVDGMTLTGNRSNTQLDNVEQIEVFKGPNAVLYGGAGASQGGMINIIRKKPQAARANELLYRAGQWGLQQGSGGTTGQVGSLPRLLYRVDTSFAYADGWRQAGSKRFNITPAVTWLISDQVRVTFNESFTRDRYQLDAGVPTTLLATGFPLDRRLNPPGDFQLTRDWQNQVVFNANVTKRLQFRNAFFSRRNRDQYLDAETLSYNATTNILSRGELYFQHNRRPLQNQSDLLGDVAVGRTRHRFMVGYSYGDQYNFSNRTGNAPGASNNLGIPIPSINIADFLRSGFVDPAPIYTSFPRTRVDYSDNKVNAAYWQDQIDLTTRLRVNVAGRYDDYRRTTHNDTYNNDVFVSVGPETGRHQTNYSYRAGAVYSLTDHHWLYASSSTTFQPVFTIPADGRELEPTRSRSFEVGHKFQALRGQLTATTAFRKILNYNILIPLGGNLFEQAGESSSRVLDFDLEGSLGHGLRTVASYGFADPQFDDFKQTATGVNLAGNQLPQAPRHTARVWGTKTVRVNAKSSITASVGGRYVAQYFTNSANTIVLPSRLTFDGGVGFRKPMWDVTVNLMNLTNVQTYYVSQINSGNQLYPGPPFNASVTLRYRFN
jgi:iron complex outermembrane receptor protein